MPKAKKNLTKRRYRRHNNTKRGGNNTDTLDALERGEKYGPAFSAPFTYDPSKIKISEKFVEPNQPSATEFFEKASKGMAEQTRLEKKYAEDMRRKNLIENAEHISAVDLFSDLPPERKKNVMKDVYDYSSSEMDPMNIGLYGIGQKRGGRKSKRTKKSKTIRRGRKSRKH